MGSMKRDTADAMANPIMKPLSSLVMNDNPSSTVVNVPPRVTVTEVKMEKATMGSCNSSGLHARRELAPLSNFR